MNYGIFYGKYPTIVEGHNDATQNLDLDGFKSVTAWNFHSSRMCDLLEIQKKNIFD